MNLNREKAGAAASARLLGVLGWNATTPGPAERPAKDGTSRHGKPRTGREHPKRLAVRLQYAQGREVGGSREKRAVGPCGQITTAEQVACTGVSRVRAGVEDGLTGPEPQLSVIHV